MNRKIRLTFINHKHKHNFKFLSFILILLFVICNITLISIYKYNSFFNKFKEHFNSKEYTAASSLILTKQNLNPAKHILLKSDLENFFDSTISNTNDSLSSNEITSTEALNIASEINRYDYFTSCNCNDLIASTSSGCYDLATSLYNEGRFSESYYIFSAIPSSSIEYETSLTYMNMCKENLKSEVISNANNLCNDNYYSKALDLFYTVHNIIGTDPEVISKISEIENKRSDFIAMQKSTSEPTKAASSNSSIRIINSSTINSLSLQSNSNYLIHVDIASQKTYVYSGTTNNWSLIKTMVCSTGKTNAETPVGTYTVKEKGNWFFSEKYQQGGKYWVQFDGNYLFHSVPYDKSQTQILDYTLGSPSSHGCIRLSEADSKWLYDNIPSGSKIIINNQS